MDEFYFRYRSSITGRFVSKKFAEKNSETTQSVRCKRKTKAKKNAPKK